MYSSVPNALMYRVFKGRAYTLHNQANVWYYQSRDLNIRVTGCNKVLIFDIGTLFIPNNLTELCGAMDKLFDFEVWDRSSIPTRGDSFVLY